MCVLGASLSIALLSARCTSNEVSRSALRSELPLVNGACSNTLSLVAAAEAKRVGLTATSSCAFVIESNLM